MRDCPRSAGFSNTRTRRSASFAEMRSADSITIAFTSLNRQIAGAHRPHLSQAPHHRPEQHGAHHHRDDADVGVEPADGLLGHAIDAAEVEPEHGVDEHRGGDEGHAGADIFQARRLMSGVQQRTGGLDEDDDRRQQDHAPLEPGGEEYRIKTLGFGLLLDEARTRHHHAVDGPGNVLARDHLRGGAEILDPAIRAGANKNPVDLNIRDFFAALQAHVI